MTDPTSLSPAARAVWEAFNSKFDWVEDGVPGPQFHSIAAALRVVADQKQACFTALWPGPHAAIKLDDYALGYKMGVLDFAQDLLSIAAELEAKQ